MELESFPSAERTATFVFRGTLALVSRRPSGSALAFRSDQSLRHLAEVLGIPSTEIGAALVDGEAWPLEIPPPDHSTVELYPPPEPVLFGQEPRFILDCHLGALGRELRLLGLDAEPRGGLDDDGFVEAALADSRILLTRDRGLLYRKIFASEARSMLVASTSPFDQLAQVCRRFGLLAFASPLSRCSACGRRLLAANKTQVMDRVPAIVAERYEEFLACPECGKVFWRGDHARSIEPLLRRLRGSV
jgi:uncharacterized protein